jgi:hypothetical protein
VTLALLNEFFPKLKMTVRLLLENNVNVVCFGGTFLFHVAMAAPGCQQLQPGFQLSCTGDAKTGAACPTLAPQMPRETTVVVRNLRTDRALSDFGVVRKFLAPRKEFLFFCS